LSRRKGGPQSTTEGVGKKKNPNNTIKLVTAFPARYETNALCLAE
jgi:hypothetical protein